MKTVLTGSNYNLERFNSVSNGTEVELIHDKENEHSQYAVSVIAKGIGLIGHMYEAYVPAGVRQYEDELTNSKTFINEVLDKNLSFRAQIIQKKPNTAIIGIVVDADNSNDEMEEEDMEFWTIGTSEEVMTLVGCGYHAADKNIGDKVVLAINQFSVTEDGKIKGTATAFNEKAESIGLLPNSRRKFNDLEQLGAKFISGDEFKSKYASHEAKTEGYVIIDISKDGRYIKLGLETIEEPVEETTTEEVVDLINDPNSAYNRMRNIMPNRDWAEDKDGRFLITKPSKEVVEPETTSEPVVEEMEEPQMNLDEELHELNSSIRALKAQKEAIEAEMEELMAKREELAAINAKRIALIEEIRNNLETLDLSVLETMKDCISSSSPEEDIPSSIEEENFVIDFKDHYEERISRFEQSDIQKENNTCDIILYYASNTWGSERTIKNVKLSDNVVEYLKSVIPHNQCMGEHVIELEMALEAII